LKLNSLSDILFAKLTSGEKLYGSFSLSYSDTPMRDIDRPCKVARTAKTARPYLSGGVTRVELVLQRRQNLLS